MSVKRSRTASSSAEAFDAQRFINFEAAERYNRYVVNRTITSERGIAPDETHQPQLVHNIRQRRWGEFVKTPEAAVVPIVREFYTNMVEGNSKSFVRGRRISFTPATINRYYQLPNFNQDDYNVLSNGQVDVLQVIHQLCHPNAEWTFSKGEAIKFKASDLSVINRVWHSFICAKLLPVTRMSDVTKERAILLYVIATDRTVDVGKVIHQSMRHIRRGSTTGGLGHASLITELCRKAGVVWSPGEELSHPKAVMDKTFIMGLREWEPEGGDAAEEIDEEAVQTNTQPLHIPHNVQRQAQASQSVEERLQRLELRTLRYHKRSEAQFQHMYACMRAHYDLIGGIDFPPPIQPYNSSDED